MENNLDTLYDFGDDVINGILGESKGDDSKENKLTDTLDKKKDTKDISDGNYNGDDYNIPKIIGTDIPSEYQGIVERIQTIYDSLPVIDYDANNLELRELSVHTGPSPTLEILNNQLQVVQAAKERLSEMMIDIIDCHTFKKRAVDILKDSWVKYSNETSADKRKADSCVRVGFFEADFAKIETLLKTSSHIAKNLDSCQENLSRRITLFQMQLKLMELGKNSLPNWDTRDKFDSMDKIMGGETNKDNEDFEASEKEW